MADGAGAGMDEDTMVFGLKNSFIADTVISALSAVGGLMMIIPFIASHKWRTKIRHKLILGLGISDFAASMVLLVSSAYSLGGNALRSGSAGCEANAFLYQVTVLTSSFWAVSIAIVTYAILAFPLSRFTALLSSPLAFPVMFLAVWVLGCIISGIGIAIYNQQDVGGFCYYATSGRMYGLLSLFIPRALVFIVTIALYISLFRFFRRQDSFAVYSNPRLPYDPSTPIEDVGCDLSSGAHSHIFSPSSPSRRYSADEALKTPFKASWRKLSLPSPSSGVGGRKMSKDSNHTLVNDEQDAGPLPLLTLPPRAAGGSDDVVVGGDRRDAVSWDTQVHWGPRVGLAARRQSTIELQVSPFSPISPEEETGDLVCPYSQPTRRRSPSSLVPPNARIHAIGVSRSSSDSQTLVGTTPPTSASPKTTSFFVKNGEHLATSSRRSSPPSSSSAPHFMLSLDEVDTPPVSPETDSKSQYPGYTAPPIPNDFLSPGSTSRRPSCERDFNPVVLTIPLSGSRAEKNGRGKGGAKDGSLAGLGGGRKDSGGGTMGSEGKERLSGQEMNRRASLLMLLYPAAYMVLFSVSIARLIVEFARSGPADPVLQGISKWMILSNGWVDATIFIFIEWWFRRSSRGRR